MAVPVTMIVLSLEFQNPELEFATSLTFRSAPAVGNGGPEVSSPSRGTVARPYVDVGPVDQEVRRWMAAVTSIESPLRHENESDKIEGTVNLKGNGVLEFEFKVDNTTQLKREYNPADDMVTYPSRSDFNIPWTTWFDFVVQTELFMERVARYRVEQGV